MRAGFGRKLIAWAVDGWIYITLIPALLVRFGVDPAAYLVVIFAGFFAVRYFLEHLFTTPGLAAMSIDFHDRVPLAIAEREDSVSIGLGLVTILTGVQTMDVALGNPTPIPLFGIILPASIFAVAIFSISILLITSGYMVARVMMAGWWMTTTLLAVWILSVLSGWQAWQDLVVEMLILKRDALSLAIRPGEAEILPSIAKSFLILPASIVILMLVGTRAQFKTPQTKPNEPTKQQPSWPLKKPL